MYFPHKYYTDFSKYNTILFRIIRSQTKVHILKKNAQTSLKRIKYIIFQLKFKCNFQTHKGIGD